MNYIGIPDNCSLHLQELFISYLTQQTHKKLGLKKDLNYNDLSDFVQAEERLEFLHQIVPKKITVKQFREILERGSSESESESDASSADDNDSDMDEELDEGRPAILNCAQPIPNRTLYSVIVHS